MQDIANRSLLLDVTFGSLRDMRGLESPVVHQADREPHAPRRELLGLDVLANVARVHRHRVGADHAGGDPLAHRRERHEPRREKKESFIDARRERPLAGDEAVHALSERPKHPHRGEQAHERRVRAERAPRHPLLFLEHGHADEQRGDPVVAEERPGQHRPAQRVRDDEEEEHPPRGDATVRPPQREQREQEEHQVHVPQRLHRLDGERGGKGLGHRDPKRRAVEPSVVDHRVPVLGSDGERALKRQEVVRERFPTLRRETLVADFFAPLDPFAHRTFSR